MVIIINGKTDPQLFYLHYSSILLVNQKLLLWNWW